MKKEGCTPKRDYYNDPHAPKTRNSIVPAVTAVVRDDFGELLMIERADNGYWALPGGAQDFGESITDADKALRFGEETGIDVEVIALSGIYSDPGHVIAYDNGEVRQEFSLRFHARPVSGMLSSDSEIRQVRWIAPDRLEGRSIHPSMRLRIIHGLRGSTRSPYLGSTRHQAFTSAALCDILQRAAPARPW